MSDKPLNVQVAEALGWTWCYKRYCGSWLGRPPNIPTAYENEAEFIPDYAKDWGATGLLIHKHKLSLFWHDDVYICSKPYVRVATRDPEPLIAACRMILVLKEQGLLNA